MRGFLVPALLLLIGGSATILLIIWLRGLRQRVVRNSIGTVLAAVGPKRCLLAASLMQDLARRGDSDAIVAAWLAIELPLLQALPDCPPDAKHGLMNALTDCASVCRVVDVSRSLMTLRNALISNI